MVEPSKGELDNLKPCTLLVSLTPVNREPRLIRQLSSLAKRGENVVVAGFLEPFHGAPPPNFVDLDVAPVPEESFSTESKYGTFFKPLSRIIRVMKKSIEPVFGISFALLSLFGLRALVVSVFFRFRDVQVRSPQRAASISRYLAEHGYYAKCVIAHDPDALRVVTKLSSFPEVPVLLDLHEHFPTQKDFAYGGLGLQVKLWEEYLAREFRNCNAMSTVSEGIMEAYQRLLPKNMPTKVVRSASQRTARSGKVGRVVRCIYSGKLSAGRGLELILESMPQWPVDFSLTLVGPQEGSYVQKLRKTIADLNLEGRAEVHEAVPYSNLVDFLSAFDVGIFVQPSEGTQKLHTLPNKFFDYYSAGLALVVSGYPEMAKIVESARNGVLVDEYSREALGAAMTNLSREQIDTMKKNSEILSGNLNWDTEEVKFLDLYGALLK